MMKQKDPILFANNVREKMANQLHFPTTEHSFEDALLMAAAMKQHLDENSTAVLELGKLKDLYDLDLNRAKVLVKKFADVNEAKDGKITFPQFVHALDLPNTDTTHALFEIFDVDGSGTIDFKEFVIGLSKLSKQLKETDTLTLAFDAFDTNHDGKITPEEFVVVMKRIQLFEGISDSKALEWFKKVDIQNNGYLTIKEFQVFAERNPEFVVIAEKSLEQKKDEKCYNEKKPS